jgi:HAE1 family hydrophobic/amphiphilic exporter-1
VVYLSALMLGLLQAALPSPSPAPTSVAPFGPGVIATAKPNVFATPQDTKSLVLPPVPAIAPAFRATEVPLPPGGVPGVDEPFVGIALDDAVAMALLRNTDLAISQSNRRIAAFQIVAAKGAYDVRFQLQPSYDVAVEPPVSAFQTGPGGGPITQITAGAQAAFAGTTTSGGSYKVFTSANRVNSNFEYNGYDPYYETSVGIGFVQPLSRNLSLDANRRQLELSKIGADLSTDDALLTASNTIDNTLNAYYTLLSAWRNVGIQEDALRSAKSQEESNSRLVAHGAAAPVDVLESDTQVQIFQDAVYSAIANVTTAQNQLKQLVLGNPADPLWTANLVPTSPISTLEPEPTPDQLVLAALKNRPEVGQLRESIREQNVNVAYQKDQKRPQVDLNLGVTENGFAGAPVNTAGTPLFGVIGQEIVDINSLVGRANASSPGLPPLTPINPSALASGVPLTGGIGTSYGSAFAGKYPEYTLSATLSLPIRNRTAEANYAIELERSRALQTQEVALIQRIQTESRNAVALYRSARSRLVAATAARQAAELVEASELRKFKAGKSTTFLVLQRQITVANERESELQAQTDLQKALVELDRVSGAILSNNHVDTSTLGTAPQGGIPNLLSPPASAPGH